MRATDLAALHGACAEKTACACRRTAALMHAPCVACPRKGVSAAAERAADGVRRWSDCDGDRQRQKDAENGRAVGGQVLEAGTAAGRAARNRWPGLRAEHALWRLCVPADLAAHAARPLLGRDCGVKLLRLHKGNVCAAYQPAFGTGLLQKLRAHARCGSRVHVIGG